MSHLKSFCCNKVITWIVLEMWNVRNSVYGKKVAGFSDHHCALHKVEKRVHSADKPITGHRERYWCFHCNNIYWIIQKYKLLSQLGNPQTARQELNQTAVKFEIQSSEMASIQYTRSGLINSEILSTFSCLVSHGCACLTVQFRMIRFS